MPGHVFQYGVDISIIESDTSEAWVSPVCVEPKLARSR